MSYTKRYIEQLQAEMTDDELLELFYKNKMEKEMEKEEKRKKREQRCISHFNSGTGVKYGAVYILKRIHPSHDFDGGNECSRCFKSLDGKKANVFFISEHKFMDRLFKDPLK